MGVFHVDLGHRIRPIRYNFSYARTPLISADSFTSSLLRMRVVAEQQGHGVRGESCSSSLHDGSILCEHHTRPAMLTKVEYDHRAVAGP